MQKNIYKTVKLVSGGLDSYIMSQEYEGKNIYVDFGQPYANEEKAALDKLGVEYEIIKINSNYNSSQDVYIPNRNLSLCSIISTLFNPDTIMLAGLRDDNCIDKNETEFGLMSDILTRYANHRVNVVSPYWQLSKGEIVANFKGDKNKLRNTFSCYNPSKNGKPCGECPACLRRAIALETNGIKCDIEIKESIIKEYLQKIYRYDQDRISRFFIYLKQRKPVWGIDIDGVLCKDEGKYEDRTPLNYNMPKDGYIILYTARLESDRKITEAWLKKYNIQYDALIMNKLPYSLLIDDKTEKIWKR